MTSEFVHASPAFVYASPAFAHASSASGHLTSASVYAAVPSVGPRSIGAVPDLGEHRRDDLPADLAAAVAGVLPGARADLERLVRIPSIWADPAHADDTRRSAEAVVRLAEAAYALSLIHI